MDKNSELRSLWEAYRATSFFAETPLGQLCLRDGDAHADLDTLLERYAVDSWAYITAYNPASDRLSEAENRHRQGQLEAAIGSAGYVFFRGQGIGQDQQWPPEPSVLVLGISKEEARELGRKFGQVAILIGRKGTPAELMAC